MMATRARSLATLVVVVAILLSSAGVGRAQTTASGDARIQQLVDLHILKGAPDGDLQLDRQINGGELVVLLERVLQQPRVVSPTLGTPSVGTESQGWIQAYAWVRAMSSRLLDARRQIGHVWFDVRYRMEEPAPWGIDCTHWMFTSLRNAYLDDGLIDLSFDPMKRIGGSDGIEMLLTAAGFGGEVDTMQARMDGAPRDDTLRIVCRQHGFDSIMDYAGKPLTRREAALMVWRLLALRTSAD
ncbi:MAG: hypothetical protein ABFD13_01890 [Candidatus Cryosericum sp.]|nr:hypothetical protein [bacterium]